MALNVLVVDDSSVMRTMMIRTLRLSGLPLGSIYQAPNGEAALNILAQEWVDLALLDINMPVMDGEELLNRVRDDPTTADLAVVMVSTEGSDTRIATLRQKGAAFVHKPFTPEQLRETIITMTGVSDESGMADSSLPGDGPNF